MAFAKAELNQKSTSNTNSKRVCKCHCSKYFSKVSIAILIFFQVNQYISSDMFSYHYYEHILFQGKAYIPQLICSYLSDSRYCYKYNTSRLLRVMPYNQLVWIFNQYNFILQSASQKTEREMHSKNKLMLCILKYILTPKGLLPLYIFYLLFLILSFLFLQQNYLKYHIS